MSRHAAQRPTIADAAPHQVRVIKRLGHGRAAVAQLVDATLPDGQVVRCVEKVFAPGLLTRTIYRLSFQAPFGYQKNRDAILAAFYRRRVAAAVIQASDIDASVAMPLYVRFCQESRAWVLAAQWVDGRGVCPASAEPERFFGGQANHVDDPACSEIKQLVSLMGQLERVLGESGLVGSGWQVAPRAMVSTANLLRTGDRYTIIDLESGIPAVLVPHYLAVGLRRFSLPPFDDVDEIMLRRWFDEQERLLLFRMGPDQLQRLSRDIDGLLNHSRRWKKAEIALLRRPWRLLVPGAMRDYQQEYLRQLAQDGVLDRATTASITTSDAKAHVLWWLGCLPGSLGNLAQRLVGNSSTRSAFLAWLRDAEVRRQVFHSRKQCTDQALVESKRVAESAQLSAAGTIVHGLLQKFTPRKLHRLISDRSERKRRLEQAILLIASPTYQSWFGRRKVEQSIDRWQDEQRLSAEDAKSLRADLSGDHVRVYVRGFGMHLALKALAPVWVPLKVAGTAAFVATGNVAYLSPLLITPALRFVVSLINWWTTRHQSIAHAEAMWAGWLPVIGLVAFPLQMFSAQAMLSTFLIRDVASKVGRRVPIYGGKDSRTEIAMIAATDLVIAMMIFLSGLVSRLSRGGTTSAQTASATPIQAADILPLQPRHRLFAKLETLARKHITADSDNAKKISKTQEQDQQSPRRIAG